MSGKNPSTPVKVSKDAANYTPAMQDAELRSSINAILLSDGHVQRLQEQLLHLLHANKANWPTAIQSHALSLLQSGEVTTFPSLMKRVLADVQQETALASPSSTSSPSPHQPDADSKTASSAGTAAHLTNGAAASNNNNKGGGGGGSGSGGESVNGGSNKKGTPASSNGTLAPNIDNDDSKNGTDSSKDKDKDSVSASASASANAANTPALALPQSVVEEALRITRECLAEIVDFKDDGTTA